MESQLDGVHDTDQVDIDDLQLWFFGFFGFDLRRYDISNDDFRSCLIIDLPSVKKTESAPLIPALATTMSTLPEDEDEIAVLKAAS